MADNVFIPGVKDSSNSQDAINKIMESKKVKLTEMEKQSEKIEGSKKIISEIKDKSLTLQNNSKKLYGFDSPFDNKISQSTDENSFYATTTKNADIGEYSIKIINKASSHKIASSELGKDYKVPAGNYLIKIGKDNYKITFSGGTLQNFADKIKTDSKGEVKANVTFNTSRTQIMTIESVKTGEKNYISFGDDKTKEVFKKMDFFEEVPGFEKNFKISKENLVNLSRIKNDPVFISDGVLLVDRTESYRFNLPEKVKNNGSIVMQVNLKLETLDPDKENGKTPTGPDLKRKGDVNIFDIYVEGETSILDIPSYQKPEKPEKIEDDHYLNIITNKREIELDELDVSRSSGTLKFELKDLLEKDETVEALVFKNRNTYKKLEASGVRFYDKDSETGLRFKHEISKPKDAVFVMDGITIQRDKNTIDDVLKGITLFILDSTDKEEKLKVDRDYQSIVKSLTEFIKSFNDVINFVNEKTSTDSSAKGEFTGDYTLNNMISKLRIISTSRHQTRFGDELSIMAQIGISTNSGSGGGLDKSKLKGLLEVNEDRLVEKIEKFPEGIKELFGYDSDKDLIIDTGVGFEIETLMKGYTTRNQGILDTKTSTLNSQIARNKKDIEDYKEKLEKEEQKLKEQFYKMEKAMDDLDKNTKKFDNFNKQK